MNGREHDDEALIRDRDGDLVPDVAPAASARDCRHGHPRAADGTHACTSCALEEAQGRHIPAPPGWRDQARRSLARPPRPANTAHRRETP
jgi:hypothetical protein